VYLCNHKGYLNNVGVIIKETDVNFSLDVNILVYICYGLRVNKDETQLKGKFQVRLDDIVRMIISLEWCSWEVETNPIIAQYNPAQYVNILSAKSEFDKVK